MAKLTTYIEDGDALTIESVNTPFADLESDVVQSSINSLLTSAIPVEGLNHNHLGNVIGEDVWTTVHVGHNPIVHNYTNKISGYNLSSIASPGWAVVVTSAGNLEIINGNTVTIDPIGVDRIGAFLVRANLHFWRTERTGGDPLSEDNIGLAATIQWTTDNIVWITIPRATRYRMSRIHQATGDRISAVDLPLCCLVRSTDVSAPVLGFRIVVAWVQNPAVITNTNARVGILECNMSAIPLHCELGTFS